MDPLAALLFTISGSFCSVLILIGTFLSVPGERATRYWAAAAIAIVTGFALAVINRPYTPSALHTISYLCVVSGYILSWTALRAFYGKRASRWSWTLAAAFIAGDFLSQAFLDLASPRLASIMFVSAVIWPLNLFEILVNHKGRVRFPQWMAIISVSSLFINALLRLIFVVQQNTVGMPASLSTRELLVFFVLPMVGGIMYASAVLLLYFERLIARSDHLATHDELTELLNRRALIASGEREIELARRMKQPLSVAFIDIDHFKSINDKHGHETGDAVLRELADLLVTTCRTVDVVGRYGGEEFCAILPGVDYPGAERVGERLVEAIRRHNFGKPAHITISVGLSVLLPGDPPVDWHDLLHQADLELYKAKHLGRDRYSLTPEQTALSA